MRKISELAIVVLVGTVLPLPAMAADKPFVTVNGAAVSQATADMFMNQRKARGMPETPELKNKIREELIRRELMIQEAKKTGFDKRPDVAAQAEEEKMKIIAQAEAAKQTVIIRAWVADFIKKNPVTDSQLKAEYDAMRAKGGDTEFKARHILVKSEEEAAAIIVKLKHGEKFEELSNQSIDQGSKGSGGDLGWSSPAKFVKPFADALISLKKGKYSETPVKSDFGYHVIKLEDTRPLKVPSFDEMRPMLQQSAQTQIAEKMLNNLRTKAKIE